MTRQKKTPRIRAEEALAVAERKVTRLKSDRAKHQGALNRAVTELEQAVVRRDYLKAHPDLKQNPTGTTPPKEDPA